MSRKIECAGKSTAFACEVLPESYELYDRLDLARDGKAIKLIVIWTLLIIVGMVVPMLFVHPVSHAFDMPASKLLFCVVAMIVGIIVYTLLHEGVHGIFIKLFTGENPTFGMEIKKGDVFLICSDGLTDMVTDREIAEILDRGALPAQMAMDLLVEALINGGRDNITVICCKAEEAKDSKESGKREKEM